MRQYVHGYAMKIVLFSWEFGDGCATAATGHQTKIFTPTDVLLEVGKWAVLRRLVRLLRDTDTTRGR